MTHQHYMHLAFDIAFAGMRANIGGPFGSIIVLDNQIIGKGCNQVSSTNDPTAHAEIVAIRNACNTINSFELKNAALYATCEPCPMCLSAIYWAGIKTVYYCSTRLDAEEIGFDDNFIYQELSKSLNNRTISCNNIQMPDGKQLFAEWKNKPDKTVY